MEQLREDVWLGSGARAAITLTTNYLNPLSGDEQIPAVSFVTDAMVLNPTESDCIRGLMVPRTIPKFPTLNSEVSPR